MEVSVNTQGNTRLVYQRALSAIQAEGWEIINENDLNKRFHYEQSTPSYAQLSIQPMSMVVSHIQQLRWWYLNIRPLHYIEGYII
jgi:hypothetical protein